MSTYSLDVQYRENLHIHIKRAHSGRSFSSNLYYNWSHNNCILFDSQWFGKENSLHPVIINRSWICQTHFLRNKCVMYAWRSLTKHSFRPQSQPCLSPSCCPDNHLPVNFPITISIYQLRLFFPSLTGHLLSLQQMMHTNTKTAHSAY